jgi:outer membrane murein-binding lipoprotein Lpp
MKRTGLLLVAGAIAGATFLYAGTAAPSPESAQIEQLKKDVADLRQRVELLEERLKSDLIPATTKDGQERPGVINPYPGLRQVPQSWKRGEFNGIPYYIVPIDTPQTPSGEAKKPAPPDKAAAPKAPDNTPKP